MEEKIRNILQTYYEVTGISLYIFWQERWLARQEQLQEDKILYREYEKFSIYGNQELEQRAKEGISGLLRREISPLLENADLRWNTFFEQLLKESVPLDKYSKILEEYAILEREHRIWYVRGRELPYKECEEICRAIIGEELYIGSCPGKQGILLFVKEPLLIGDIKEMAYVIVEELSSQLLFKAKVCISQAYSTYRLLKDRYQQLEWLDSFHQSFYPNEGLCIEEEFVLGVLIQSTSLESQQAFIDRVLSKEAKTFLEDTEVMTTLYQFFNHNLNIAETSRSLFIHRNTLVYRLDKISEKLGKDIRNFEVATYVQIALMLQKALEG